MANEKGVIHTHACAHCLYSAALTIWSTAKMKWNGRQQAGNIIFIVCYQILLWIPFGMCLLVIKIVFYLAVLGER